MDFWQIVLKIEEIERAAILRSMDKEASNIQVRLQTIAAFGNYYLIPKIGT